MQKSEDTELTLLTYAKFNQIAMNIYKRHNYQGGLDWHKAKIEEYERYCLIVCLDEIYI